MIYVRTCAYNAEKTISRTIESILNQTYSEFTYYILDNGSTDNTREIIRSYAKKDSRIVPFYAERNHDITECTGFWNLFYSLQEEDYLCSLDADDVYEVTFLEEMLHFMIENDLDMAACGSIFMEADSWKQCGERVLSKNIVIRNNEDLDKYFPAIHWNLRQTWGKLYSAKAARMPYMVHKPEWYPKAYGGDTVNTLEAVKLSSRIGVLARPLHYYAISMKTVSHKWIKGREKSDVILFEKAKELLIEKCGDISKRNLDFLFAVYFYALNDTFRTLFNSNISAEQKIQITKEIFCCSQTQEMFQQKFGVDNKIRFKLFEMIVVQLLALWNKTADDSFDLLEMIFSSINADFKCLFTKESFIWWMNNHLMIVRNIILREYEKAINNLLLLVDSNDTKLDKDLPYILGQQLAALQNDEEKYVIFSKKLIKWDIMNNQFQRAGTELEEWSTILPNDKYLKELQGIYQKKMRGQEDKKGNNLINEVLDRIEWDALKTEYDFLKYVTLLRKVAKKYVVIIATRDTPWGSQFSREKTEALKNIGFKVDLFEKFRYAYVAIMDSGEVLFEKIGTTIKDIVTCKLMLNEERVVVNSSGFEADVKHSFTSGSILINGKELSPRGRGLNIVVYDKVNKSIFDVVNFDTYSNQLSARHPFKVVERVQRFWESHKGVEMFCVKSPSFPKQNLTTNEKFILNNNVIRETIIANMDKPVFAINKYYDRAILKEVFAVPKSYHDINGIRRFEDVHGKWVNVEGGHRITSYQSSRWKRTIYIIGGCSVFGIGATDEDTMASWLQKILNEKIGEDIFRVQNYGYFLCEADRQREEEIDILESLPVKSGDIIVYYWTDDGISPLDGFPMIDASTITEQPRNCEVFFDKAHLTPDGYRLIAEKIYDTLLERNMLNPVDDVVEESTHLLELGFEEKNAELLEYKKFLINFYNEMFSPMIGSIVMNCNPFTLGHRYLIEQALKQCDFLVIFLVEEEGSYFSFEDRTKLIVEGTADLSNVAIIPSGRFIISSLTFKDYFNKTELQDKIIDTSLDVVLFAKEIAPCLHIKKRFVGEEPFDKVTKQYNETMKRVLPEYGIEFVEIPRKQEDGEAISASRVRALLEKREFEDIKKLVPFSTYQYLIEKYVDK